MRSLRNACWIEHARGVCPSQPMRHWLTDRGSLTQKLIAASGHFRVRRLRQGSALSLADEFAQLALPRRMRVQEREVLLVCDGQPVVFAHTIMSADANASDWPFFSSLGERSLGTTLFGDPLVRRAPMQFARLAPTHPLVRRARAAVAAEWLRTMSLPARRCVFKRKQGSLLVTEVFLPTLAGIGGPQTSQNDFQSNR